MRKIAKQKVPDFKTEDEERKFWESHDSVDYVDWSKAEQSRFPKLKPSTESISLRLSVSMLEGLKIEANKRDVPYQSLLKMWLADKLEEVSKGSTRDGGPS
jgi:predicted DNA binding CopG/RHH family protein